MRRKWPLLLAVLAAASVLLLWYLYPRSFAQILPDFSPERLTYCDAALMAVDPAGTGGEALRQISLDIPSPEYEQLMDLLASASYRRSFKDLLFFASDAQPITMDPYFHLNLYQDPDHRWSLAFYGGQLVAQRIPNGPSRSYVPSGGLAFQEQAAAFLASLAN